MLPQFPIHSTQLFWPPFPTARALQGEASQRLVISKEKGTLTPMLILLTFVLSLIAPAAAPATAATPTVTAAATNKCWCQTMPGKDWGK
jgi:hypothetical protein